MSSRQENLSELPLRVVFDDNGGMLKVIDQNGNNAPWLGLHAAEHAAMGLAAAVTPNTLTSYSASSKPGMPTLDLNYADKMALSGAETFARATTDTYNDMLGVSQTAAANVAAFDRQQMPVVNNAWVPRGFKSGSPGQLSIAAIAGVLPATGFTIIVDCDTPNALSGYGPILTLSSGVVANRVQFDRSSTYNALFTVQSGGTVIVNNQSGTQTWYGGPRRLVISCAPNSFSYCDDGRFYGTVTSGSMPSGLTKLDIGWSSISTLYYSGWVKRIQIIPVGLSVADTVNAAAGYTPVACWGDSLTAGTGTTGQANYYPEVLRLSRYPHSGVYNGGVGGETSTQVAVRAVADTIRNAWTSVYWVGRNNITSPSVVLNDIAAMVATLTHKRFLVLSVINRADGTEAPGSTAYSQIMAINSALATAYPNNYLDIRSLLVTASGGANDQINASWSADGLHLNNTGYAYVAAQVSSWLAAKQWF